MESRGLMAVNRPTVLGLVRVLIAFMTAALVACGGGGGGGGGSNGAPRVVEEPVVAISGRVAVQDQSLEGAKISLGRIDVSRSPVTENVKGKVILLETSDQPPVVDAGGDISFQAPAAAILDDQLFSVAVTCEPVSERCPYKMPLHAVMSGARLKQGEWIINITTEIANQRLAYYVAARFSEADLKQEMDTTAKLLLRADVDGVGGIDYEDLLRWDAAGDSEGAALLRPGEVTDVENLLQAGAGANAVKLSLQSLVSPVLGSVALSERGGRKVRVYGDLAFVQMYGPGVRIVDVSDPMNPEYLSTLFPSLSVNDFVVSAGYAYVVIANFVYVYDVGNPASPTRLYEAERELPSAGWSIQKVGDYAYVCLGDSIQIVNLVTPRNPGLIEREWTVPCGNMVVDGQRMAVLEGSYSSINRVRVFDVADPESPVEMGVYEIDGYVQDLCLDGHYIHLLEQIGYPKESSSGYLDRVTTIDVLRTNSSGVVSQLHLPYFGFFSDMHCDDERLLIVGSKGVSAIDVAVPESPVFLSTVNIETSADPSEGRAVDSNGQYLFVAGGHLKVLNDLDFAKSVRASLRVSNVPIGSRADGSMLYFVDSSFDLNAIDFSDVDAPVIFEPVNVGESMPLRLWKDNSHIYGQRIDVATAEVNYWYAEIGELKSIKSVSDISLPFDVQADPELNVWIAYAVRDSVAYVADAAGFSIVDMTNPAVPVYVSRLELGAAAIAMKLAGDYLYLRGVDYLYAVNIKNASAPDLVSRLALNRNDFAGVAIEYYENYVYLTARDKSIVIVDVRQPDVPKVVGSLPVLDVLQVLEISGRYLYAISDRNYIQVFDLANPAQPVMLGYAWTKGQLINIATGSSYLFASTGYGIEILPLIPPN